MALATARPPVDLALPDTALVATRRTLWAHVETSVPMNTDCESPDHLTPAERRRALAAILATGIRRMRTCLAISPVEAKREELSDVSRDPLDDLPPAWTHGVVHCRAGAALASRRGESEPEKGDAS